MDWSEKGTFRRGAPHGNPSTRTRLLASDRRTSYGSKKPTEVPEETERSTISPYNSLRTEVFNIITEVFIVPW